MGVYDKVIPRLERFLQSVFRQRHILDKSCIGHGVRNLLLAFAFILSFFTSEIPFRERFIYPDLFNEEFQSIYTEEDGT